MKDATRNIVERASQGDEKAVDRLLELHLPGLRQFMRAQVAKRRIAVDSPSDLVQSTCREVLLHVDRYRYRDESSFKNWLYASALRKLLDRQRYHRAQRRDARKNVSLDQSGAAGPSTSGGARLRDLLTSLSTPSRHAAGREELALLERAFAELPERYREVITLARLDGVSYPEIARRLEISEANARMLVSRALARLARLMDEPGK